MTRMLCLTVLVCLISLARPVSAAVVFEPTQVQFSQPHGSYFYGGHCESMHRFAQRSYDPRIVRDAEGQLSAVPSRVFSDRFSRLNASLYGYTKSDAINDANASIPRYFRKADLYRSGRLDEGGNLIVPAVPSASCSTGSVEIKPFRAWPMIRTAKPVLIVPKTQLNLDAPLTLPAVPSSKA